MHLSFNARIAALLTVLITTASRGEESHSGEIAPNLPKWSVRTEVLMVAVPEATFLELLPALRSPSTIDAACDKLLEAVKSGKAILTGYPVVFSDQGQRAVGESIVEKRYPVEFEPPQVPQTFGNSTPTKTTRTAPPAPKDGNSTALPSLPFPTSFETRNVGVTLEAESIVSADGKHITINAVPQRVEFLGFDNFGAERIGKIPIPVPDQPRFGVDQPRFALSKVTFSLTIKNGEKLLVAVNPLSKPEKYVEVFVLQANATSINR
jgi:hypothetical protein